MPIFVNSPDFEPDSERQSLILNGVTRDEEKNVIEKIQDIVNEYNKKIEEITKEKEKELIEI